MRHLLALLQRIIAALPDAITARLAQYDRGPA